MGLSVIGFFNQQLADKLAHNWNGVSRWWSLVPIGIFVAYRMLEANYKAFAMLEQRLRTQQDEEKIQSVLGELLADGSDLRVDYIESKVQYEAWRSRFSPWPESVLDALGEFGLAADYALFQNADAMGDSPIGITTNWQDEVRESDEILKRHLHALAGILRTRPKITFETTGLHERERF
jgi:hypothetical protein